MMSLMAADPSPSFAGDNDGPTAVTIRLVNLTPHRLHVMPIDGHTVLDLLPCPVPPRVNQRNTCQRNPDRRAGNGPRACHPLRHDATITAPQTGVLLVVPRVLARESDRADLLFPDEEIRDPEGRIIGCRRLARFAGPP